MLQDAAKMVLEVARVLDAHGMTLWDAGPSTCSIDRSGRPVFAHLMGIVEQTRFAFPAAEFFSGFVWPLMMLERQPGCAELIRRAGSMSQRCSQRMGAIGISSKS